MDEGTITSEEVAGAMGNGIGLFRLIVKY